MATEVTIGGNGTLFVGEDKTLRLELLDPAGVPVNMATFTIKMIVRIKEPSPDPPILDKTATVSGTYSAVRATNAQRAVVTLTDTEMDALSGRTYRHSWKRTNTDNETILSFGPFIVEEATAK